MTKFNEAKTKEIILPDCGAKIVIKDFLTFGTSLEMVKYENEMDSQLFMVKEMIVSWDFTNEKDEPLPITTENIKKLSPIDGQFIVSQITKFFVSDKKKEN